VKFRDAVIQETTFKAEYGDSVFMNGCGRRMVFLRPRSYKGKIFLLYPLVRKLQHIVTFILLLTVSLMRRISAGYSRIPSLLHVTETVECPPTYSVSLRSIFLPCVAQIYNLSR